MTENHDADLPRCDETVGDTCESLPPGAAGEELMRQRAMHGLLRAMHTADAEAREARVTELMSRLRARPARVFTIRHIVAAAASVAVIAVIAVSVGGGPELPLAHATITEAAKRLDEDVDRRFELKTWKGPDRDQLELTGDHSLKVRGENRFLLEWRGIDGDFDVGCDGEILWFMSNTDLKDRRSAPIANAKSIFDVEQYPIFELGYADFGKMIERLPDAGDKLRTKERRGPAGKQILVITGRDIRDSLLSTIEELTLHVEEQTHMVLFADFWITGIVPTEIKRLSFGYEGELPYLANYSKPF